MKDRVTEQIKNGRPKEQQKNEECYEELQGKVEGRGIFSVKTRRHGG